MDERNKKYSDDVEVSLVIPVYNVSAYIERCLTSVFAQTYTNIECILVDDVTPDDSIVKCEKLISQYAGPITFQILHHEKNRGLSAARNTGTEAATGLYIYYLDSDDEITPECISLLVDAVKLHPDVEIVQGQVKAVPHIAFYNRNILDGVAFIDDNFWIREHFYKLDEKLPLNAWDKLIKRSFLEKYHLFFKEGLIYEDQQWMFFVVKHLSKYAVVHQPTYIHYCGVEGSIMSINTSERLAYHWSVILNDVVDNLDYPMYDCQLLVYLPYVINYYGQNGKVTYTELIRKYKKELASRKYYMLFFSLILLQLFYPLTHGKGFRRIANYLTRKKFSSISYKIFYEQS